MKTIRIVTVAVLMVASAWALHAQQAVNTPANENREEQSKMTNEKVIMLIEAKIQPHRRAERFEASRHEKTIPIHLLSTRSTGRKQHRISIFSRTLLRNSWRR